MISQGFTWSYRFIGDVVGVVINVAVDTETGDVYVAVSVAVAVDILFYLFSNLFV